ncbi:MAG: branched-chain amino acid ABC transporter permease [Acidimicrobiales bacterium]
MAAITHAFTGAIRSGRRGPARDLVLSYADDIKLLRSPRHTPWRWVLVVGGLALFLWLPTYLGDPGLRVLAMCGIFAIGAIGLNLLTGYTGQISLGHAFFVGVGAYSAAYFGAERGLPMPVYLAVAAILGFVVGGIIGPFALRLRGNYLVVVTLGLVFLGEHLWDNWDSVTGGGTGTSLREASMSLGPLDFKEGIELGGEAYTFEQSFFWLVWALVIVGALLAKNLVRSRAGRAMQAIRDRDLSAEVIGVSPARYKVGAFAWSGAYAAVAGALYGLLQQFVSPGEFGLFLAINYVAMIIIGGLGTIFGSIVGALFVWGGRSVIEQNSGLAVFDPLITDRAGEAGIFNIGELNAVLFGLAIVLFLLFEPRGLAAFWFRIKTWFLTWPFSY